VTVFQIIPLLNKNADFAAQKKLRKYSEKTKTKHNYSPKKVGTWLDLWKNGIEEAIFPCH
jgi:hypothetical protein